MNKITQKKHYNTIRKKKYTHKRRGGVTIKNESNTEQEFHNFLKGCSITFLGFGSNGLTFTVKNRNSGYKVSNINKHGRIIDQILMKIVLINNKKKNKVVIDNTNKEPILLSYATKKEFNNEVKMQNNIFFATNKALQPICPGVLYKNMYIGDNNQYIVDILENLKLNSTNMHTNTILTNLLNYSNIPKGKKVGIGIIGMEYIDAKPLFDLRNHPRFEEYKHMALFSILRLAIEAGVHHADYHLSNIMIIENNNTYFNGRNGAPILIDFGYSTFLSDNNWNKIKNLYKKHKFTAALEVLCPLPRSDGLDLMKHLETYGWVCANTNASDGKLIDNTDKEKIRLQIDSSIYNLKDEFLIAKNKNTIELNKKFKKPMIPVNGYLLGNQKFPNIQ